MIRLRYPLLALLGPLGAWASAATVTPLYTGSLGSSPQSQGYLEYTSGTGLGVETTAAGSTTYSSTITRFEAGGFSNQNTDGSQVNAGFPALNAATGFSVDLTMQELTENHGTDNDRAGLSLIALSSTGKGIEIAFWSDHVWAQSDTFTHAEDAAFSTLASTNYDLTIAGSTYTLSGNGTAILTGALRDYSGSRNMLPYTSSNFVFIGDDTTEASGSFSFSSLSVTTPEPASLALIVAVPFAWRNRRVPTCSAIGLH